MKVTEGRKREEREREREPGSNGEWIRMVSMDFLDANLGRIRFPIRFP